MFGLEHALVLRFGPLVTARGRSRNQKLLLFDDLCQFGLCIGDEFTQ